MADKNWSQLGDEIESMVRSALESKDFGRLNQDIARTAEEALGNVERSVQKAMDRAQETMKHYGGIGGSGSGNTGNGRGAYGETGSRAQSGGSWSDPYGIHSTTKGSRFQPGYAKQRLEEGKALLRQRFRSTSGMKAAGIALVAVGYPLLGFSLLGLGVSLPILLPGSPDTAIIATTAMSPALIGGGFMAWKGSSLLGLTKRFRQYLEILRDREYCQIQELSDRLGKPNSYIRKDLGKMLRRGLFLQGHLDRQATCLMVTDEAYSQYQIAEKQREVLEKEQRERAAEDEKLGKRRDLSDEARSVIAAGRDYLREIKESNSRIPGEEISGKISRLELIITKIFNRVEQHPELVDDLGRFMDYYLPTTLKLLHAYEELDAQPIQGENISASKREIEETLDTIDQAFEKLLDSFFENTAWDISTDISVLHNMFAQEGLTEGAFDKVRKQ